MTKKKPFGFDMDAYTIKIENFIVSKFRFFRAKNAFFHYSKESFSFTLLLTQISLVYISYFTTTFYQPRIVT